MKTKSLVDYFYAHFMISTYIVVTLIYSIIAFFFIDFHAVTYLITVMSSLFLVDLFFSRIESKFKDR